MSSNPVRLKYLFDKYVQNTCSKAELQEFWQLMSQLSENDLINGQMKVLWDEMPAEAGDRPDAEGMYRSIMERAEAGQIDYLKAHRRYRRPAVMYLGIAASLLALFSLGWWLTDKPAPQAPPAKTPSIAQAPNKVVTLSDGTTAILNKNSRLDYPPEFSGAIREVKLSGEAYFHVKQNEAQPFVVHTGNITTTVLGTSFNIKAYPDEQDIAVTVTSGKVQVADKRRTLAILVKNNQLVVNRQTGLAAKAEVNSYEITSWRKQDLVFRNVTMEEAAVILSRHFDADIRFESENLRHCRFTGSFLSINELDQILDVITSITGASWKKEGNVILITGQECAGGQL